MAGVVKVAAQLNITNETFELRKKAGTSEFVQDNPGGGVPGTVTATVAGVDVDLSPLTTEGWVRLQNIDLVNNVEWGPFAAAAFHPIGIMEPGEPAMFRMSPGKTLRIKAVAGTPLVLIEANED